MVEADALPVKVAAAEEPSHDIDLDNAVLLVENPQPVHHKKSRRKDIQCLRAVAISSVLCFHLWPKVFTCGYLGVDIFYVISGYLMAQMLSKHGCLNLIYISNFYCRRIQRIVPIYALLVYATLHAGSFLLSTEDFKKMGLDAISALTFTTNFQKIFKDDDYFSQVFTYRFFLHTWSLAVEMQFYLLVPFIFYFLLKPCIKSKAGWISLVVMMASFGLQVASTETIAFGLVFCRFWQFFAGIIAYFVGAENNEQSGQDEIDLFTIECVSETKGLLQVGEAGSGQVPTADALPAGKKTLCNRLYPMLYLLPNTLLTLLLLALFMPWLFARLRMELLQVFVVLCTACLLYLGSFQEHIQIPCLLTNRASLELGNASYIWYLIHWPVIQFSIYWSAEGVLNVFDGLLILLVTASTAVAIERLVDARIRRISSFKNVLMVISAFYVFCLVFIIPPETFHQNGSEETAPFSGEDMTPEPITTPPALTTTIAPNNTDQASQLLNETDPTTLLHLLPNATTTIKNSTT